MQYYLLKYKEIVAKKIYKYCFVKQYCHLLSDWDQGKKDCERYTNQQGLFNLLGMTQKTIEKNEKDSRKFNDNKTSLQSKRVCEDLERTAIDKKQKIEKIHKESNKESIKSSVSITTVTDTKEPDQSNRQLGSTTIIDTTIK